MTKTDQPIVSVVLVIRNVERYLAEAIESILHQTFHDFEFIIVDFGSTDKSKEIAGGFAAKDERIKLSEIPPCSYIEAKVAACSLPKGRYIAIQDADDLSLPDRLETEVGFLESHPKVGLLGGAVQWIDSQGKRLETPADYPTENREIRAELRTRNPFWHPTVLMLKEAFDRVGGYRRVFVQSDDYDLWLRISEHYECANLKQKVLNYRIHPSQLSFRCRKDQILCALAAQGAAALRREGKPDPLNGAKEITPALLAEMGVSEYVQKKELASGYCGYIKHMFEAGGYAAVPEATAEMIQACEGSKINPRLIADMHILSAKAYWKQSKPISGLHSVAKAVRARPRILGRPVRALLDRLRFSYLTSFS
jgi:glycosyltransferase involved in cell wall biosynthesis